MMLEQILERLNEEGWVHQPNLLSLKELQEINSFFNEQQAEFRPALIGKRENRSRVTEIRGDYTYWIDPSEPPSVFLPIIKFLEEFKLALNRHFYLGLKEFECHLARYPEGTFYKKHSDRFEADSSRSITFIFYLHENWRPGDGGELVMFNGQDEVLTTIEPLPGSFVSFISADFPHEVKLAHKERRSLTGWMHTKLIY